MNMNDGWVGQEPDHASEGSPIFGTAPVARRSVLDRRRPNCRPWHRRPGARDRAAGSFGVEPGFRRSRPASVAVAAGLLLAFPGMISSRSAVAEEPASSLDSAGTAPRLEWATSIRWENDTFGGSDRFYTDDISLAVSHTGPSWIDPLADWLPWGDGRRTVGYDVGQAMFTPSDTGLAVPDPDDRPYAGILAIGLSLHVEKENSYHGLKVVTGVVGPSSLAEETQNAVHDCIGNDKAQGWDHQLEDEPILNLAYEYRHRFLLSGEPEHWSAQAFPLGGGWLGNMLIQGQAGGVIRLGYNQCHPVEG